MKGLMIVGTDTGVGKTTLCELLLTDAVSRGESVGIYKPVCTGSELDNAGNAIWNDIERLHAASGGTFDRDCICPQRFHAPLAPPVAAKCERRDIDSELLVDGLAAWQGRVETLLIEGVGGLLCPVSEEMTVADLSRNFNVPIIVVSANRLGTINHTLLTLEVARQRGLEIAGWVMNHVELGDATLLASNVTEICRRTDTRFLGEITFQQTHRLQFANHSTKMFAGSPPELLRDIWSFARPIGKR